MTSAHVPRDRSTSRDYPDVPQSIADAQDEHRELVLTSQEIDAQLSDDERSADRDWRRRALHRKTRVMSRLRFLKDWMKGAQVERMRHERSILDGTCDNDPAGVLVGRLRRELLHVYAGKPIPHETQLALDAATTFIQTPVKDRS
jgi:hypothetical protein